MNGSLNVDTSVPPLCSQNIEIWKVKKLVKSLEAARGNGTSMISLIIPPRGAFWTWIHECHRSDDSILCSLDQISRVAKMLADEYGTASNIKSRVNRLSVLSAITSTQQRLKLYNKVPTNGLIMFVQSTLLAVTRN
jgi:peptide chain release factor subunit 1